MLYQKGGTDHEPCQHSSGCGHKGWTWPSSTGHCHDPASICHNPGSLSHDTEGSCQSSCPPQGQLCPAPQSSKPRRRVEVSPVPPVCPPPVKIHRRPLEQHRPLPPCPEPQSCGKQPRRRVEQCPEQDEEPPVVLQPLPLQHRCPCIQRCPRAVPRCCPPPVPLPPHPCHHQQQQKVTLVPLSVKN
ncbi:putative small proline-rich protein 5 [Oenanthe melanoleuca]|uniref:putative small proline-rich protein 5 n=1 Tax=Oenanthe melanoleuca TaxID=2939378 RepID=UPI0024C17D61|nr:putative small proline-rich protein 5 [Oenanthe melanoleuca]